MKILWADDQLEVAETVSRCIGGTKGHAIKFVADGEQALELLKSSVFDILLVDLAMPPGRWGGLWLLEEIKRNKLRVPVVVLSGEGTQKETITALRLGARDYVTKESVDSELAKRIASLLNEMWNEVEGRIITDFPSVISIAYKRYISSTSDLGRVRKLVDIYEWSLRMACIVGLSDLRAGNALPGERPGFLREFGRPSMGLWNALRLEMLRNRQLRADTRSILASFDKRNVEIVISTRNDLVHGGEWSDRMADDWLRTQEVELRKWLCRMWQVLRFSVVVSLTVQYDGQRMTHDCRLLAGESPVLGKTSVVQEVPLVTGHGYVISETGSGVALDLHPLLIASPSEQPNSWELSAFDGWERSSGSSLVGSEKLRYVQVWSGRRTAAVGESISSLPALWWAL